MVTDDIILVVCRNGLYLDGSDDWGPYERAWRYGTVVAFNHAEEYGGHVKLVLPSGRQIDVMRSDFIRPTETP